MNEEVQFLMFAEDDCTASIIPSPKPHKMRFDFTLNNGQVQALVNLNGDLKLAMDTNTCMALMAITTIFLAVFQPHPIVLFVFVSAFGYHLVVRAVCEEPNYYEVLRANSKRSIADSRSSGAAPLAWSWTGFKLTSKNNKLDPPAPPSVMELPPASESFATVDFPFNSTIDPFAIELNQVKNIYGLLLRMALSNGTSEVVSKLTFII